ncbi:MAG: cysteine--tRNA ligase [Candidatus Brocadiaceae bacterium]|nr:cysteine--tRNA ligase [Candidatus Brocadiaceae bacterium]
MLKVYNSLGRELQEFKPLHEGFVGVYVCGPTVYGHSHLGHAKSYISFDVVVRYLRHRFPDCRVRYVQNITDVGHLLEDVGEDRVLKKARETGLQPMEVVEEFTRSYFEDMDALNVQRPDISPRASGHVPEQIKLVRTLLDRGHAYEVDGSVYFDVSSFPEYGRLSGRSAQDVTEAVRVEEREEKRRPADFAIWKRAEPAHIMRWSSPWGEGFPGWHAECSAMSMKYLGETVDIHGGGLDNIFPHHEDEVAQSEAATGRPFARYWLHNGMVTVNGQKMSKSLGNYITIKDAFSGDSPLGKPVRPMVLRYFILTSHYRSPMDISVEALDAAEKGLERIETTVARVRRMTGGAGQGDVPDEVAALVEDTRTKFLAEMDNDFNTAGALGVLSTFTREANRLLDEQPDMPQAALQAMDALYDELGGQVLGIVTAETAQGASAGIEAGLIEAMLDVREELRKAKQFELADRIRDRLGELGVEVKDGPDGAAWQWK